MDQVLLITGAINIMSYQVPETKIVCLQERLHQYLSSIEYAIEHYRRITHILFCENTNYRYDYSVLQEKAKQNGKILEVLSFAGDYDAIQKRGKGYGEGEIIAYALSHSAILRDSIFFYKLTGRVIVKNMDKLIKFTSSNSAFIFPLISLSELYYCMVSTVFYKVDTGLYKQWLLDAYHDVFDNRNLYLEHVFYNRLKDIPLSSFGRYPVLEGRSGSTGKSYAESKKQLLKNSFLNRLHYFSNTEKNFFQMHLFSIIRWLKNIKKQVAL